MWRDNLFGVFAGYFVKFVEYYGKFFKYFAFLSNIFLQKLSKFVELEKLPPYFTEMIYLLNSNLYLPLLDQKVNIFYQLMGNVNLGRICQIEINSLLFNKLTCEGFSMLSN